MAGMKQFIYISRPSIANLVAAALLALVIGCAVEPGTDPTSVDVVAEPVAADVAVDDADEYVAGVDDYAADQAANAARYSGKACTSRSQCKSYQYCISGFCRNPPDVHSPGSGE